MTVTGTTNVQLQARLLTRQQVATKANDLVRKSRTLVNETEVFKSDMDNTQLSNLLGVALDADGVEVIINYIRYQVGRDDGEKPPKSWGRNQFGQRLVQRLNNLRDEAEVLAQNVLSQLEAPEGEVDQATLTDQIWLELARETVGQLHRYFVFRKTVPSETEQEATE